ncbi:hypothetical protein GCM10009096_03810 [Parasphingorhabdus litoris]|uniref:HTH tetR-type domain-containing protein n=1 Tax=Parasphingorhabdus litoris TaxID=394733 RepID=A0ABN1A367_9SPHN|nr:TetR/AcrR family transcriptional regulator [Parasphingorhabdus litoris]
MEARQSRSKNTVERILASVLVIYAEKGLKAVTHRAVAEHAGVSVSSTTRFFKSKPDLISKAYQWGVEKARARYASTAEEMDFGDKAELVQYCRSVLGADLNDHAVSNLAWYHFLIESTRDPSLRPITVQSFSDMSLFWRDLARRSGIEDETSIQTLLDYLIGEYYLVFAASGSRSDEVGRAQRRVRRVAQSIQASTS